MTKIVVLSNPFDPFHFFQNRLADAERRVAQSHQRFTKIQNDYQILLGIATDLVDTLEGALRGDHIEPTVLQQICSRLVASQRGSGSASVGSSGAFGDTLGQTCPTSANFSYGDTLRQSLCLRQQQENGGLVMCEGVNANRLTDMLTYFLVDITKDGWMDLILR